MEKVYRNVSLFFILVFIAVQWGFYKSYTSQFPEFKDFTSIHHIHGALMISWLVLLITQPIWIMTGKQHIHRTIGKLSYVLGPLIIVSLFFVMKTSYYNGLKVAPEKLILGIRVLDIRGLFSFAIFWALAMINRKNSASHMRYMIGTGILSIGPGIGRGLATFGIGLFPALTITDIIDLVIVGILLGYDIYKKRNYKPYLVIFIVLAIGTVLWQLKDSDAWQAFARKWAELFF